MYEHNANQLIMPDEFFLPFGGQLNPDNRWVVMASLIPWAEIEEEYIKRLGDASQGSKAYSVRLALGSLIIKEKMGLSDEETVLSITENPYLQYFIGLQEFQQNTVNMDFLLWQAHNRKSIFTVFYWLAGISTKKAFRCFLHDAFPQTV